MLLLLFMSLYVPGGGLEPHQGGFFFWLNSGGLLPLKRNVSQVTYWPNGQHSKLCKFHKNGTLGATGSRRGS